jgi:hypothetical protein
MKRIFATLATLALALPGGCHAQVPPASPGYNVNLTATAPVAQGTWAGCTTAAPCTYAVYRATGASCPATTSTAWAEITNSAVRPSTPAFTDTTATGLSVCYTMETVQSGLNSAASNVAGPVAVAGIPLAPTLGTPTQVVAALAPSEGAPTLSAMKLVAWVEPTSRR